MQGEFFDCGLLIKVLPVISFHTKLQILLGIKKKGMCKYKEKAQQKHDTTLTLSHNITGTFRLTFIC